MKPRQLGKSADILAALDIRDPASRKRAVVAAIASAVALGINPFLQSRGYQPIGVIEFTAFTTIVSVFLGQSGVKSIVREKKVKAQAVPEGVPPAA